MCVHKNGSCSFLMKVFIYLKIGIHVLFKYRHHLSFLFVRQAATLLFAFWHDKLIRLPNGTYKLHLYIPAYPTRAFFRVIENKLIANPPKPITVVYSTTKACTYKCKHCYQRLDKGRDVSLDILLKTAQAMNEAGVCYFNIEGGDTFLRFDDLCALLDTFDEGVEVWINTTGAHVTKEKLAVLKQKGCCGLMVSIHGDTPAKHDEFVGVRGAYEKAIETIKYCTELGLGTAFNTVLTTEELKKDTLKNVMMLAKDIQCHFVQLIHAKRAGKWLGKEELYKEDTAVEDIIRAHRYYNNSFRGDYPALPAQVEEERPTKFGCTAGGIDRFYVGASGEVQPCEFLNISVGNVCEEEFDVIFKRMRSYFKVPCANCLCVTQAGHINELMQKHGLTQTPVPYTYSKELLETWDRGEPTRLYQRLRLYK